MAPSTQNSTADRGEIAASAVVSIPPAANDAAATPAANGRDQFIPVRKSDILNALLGNGSLLGEGEPEPFRQFCRLLASIFHYEYFERLEKLREAYFYFNPDLKPGIRFEASALERSYADLIKNFDTVLKGANFIEVPHDEIERAHRESAVMQVELYAPVEDFRDVRFFRRGRHKETFELKKWFGLKRYEAEVEVYDDVVLFVATKAENEIDDKRDLKRFKQNKIRPGCVLIKYFRSIASADLNALFPNVRVVMSLRDKFILGIPALAGGIPIFIKFASTFTVLIAVLGFYLGFSAAVGEHDLSAAIAAMGGVVAVGGFAMRQWVKYQRQSLRYQKELTDNVYFRNVNNNAGIFDYMIGAAEEQECKEAFLAFYFLHTSTSPLSMPELDRRIEAWLKDQFAIDIDFEVDDALAKLDRLGLLVHEGDRYSVVTVADGLARLDQIWDDYFRFAPAPPGAAPTAAR